MAYLTTGADLKADGLALAGESATASEYDDDCYEWLTVVHRALVSGGPFGPSILEPLDWPWARAYPRGHLQLEQPFNRDFSRSAVFFTGGSTVTFLDPGTVPDLRFWRIARSDVAARHLILSQTQASGFITCHLQDPWTGPSDSVDDWLAYPDTYLLPDDFVRGCSPLYVSGVDMLVGPKRIDVLDPAQMEQAYPHGVLQGGIPDCAARVTQDRVRFSHYLDTPSEPRNVQVEFEYIQRPDVIAEGTVPRIPLLHRRVLSYGLAYLILDDKDDSTAPAMWQRFQAQWKAMRDEVIREGVRMSSRWGVLQPPRASSGGVWRTEAGLPVWSW